MKPVFLMLSGLSLLHMLCAPVMAQHTGPYAGGYLGGNLLADSRADDTQGSFNLTFKPALQGGVVLGWDLGLNNPLGEGRIELEYARRSNQLDQVEFAEGSFTGSGRLTVDSVLFNCIGVSRGNRLWSPYVIAGLGAARVDVSAVRVTGQPLSNDTATVFAYQLGGGVAYELTDVLLLDLGYRFFSSSRPEFTEVNGDTFTTDFFSHSVVFGLRVGF